MTMHKPLPRRFGALVLCLGAALLLPACGGKKDPVLMNAAANNTAQGPDEFAIVPNKPLQTPTTIAQLPTPTPGGANLADPDPRGDMAVALGGRRSATRPGGNIEGPALISHVTRFGINQSVRPTLAKEDREYRQKARAKPLEKLFAVNVYFTAYAPMSLDQYAEFERLRRAGVQTPAAPPQLVQ